MDRSRRITVLSGQGTSPASHAHVCSDWRTLEQTRSLLQQMALLSPPQEQTLIQAQGLGNGKNLITAECLPYKVASIGAIRRLTTASRKRITGALTKDNCTLAWSLTLTVLGKLVCLLVVLDLLVWVPR